MRLCRHPPSPTIKLRGGAASAVPPSAWFGIFRAGRRKDDMKQVDVLQTVAWGMCHFGSLLTGRGCPRQDMLREKGRGMVKSVGMVPQCDDDGSIIETRQYREGWVLTEDGITQLRLLSPEAAETYLPNVELTGR